MLSRRDFLKSCTAALGYAATGLTGRDTAFRFSLERTELAIPVPDLPREFEQYRIGFLSDFHLGPFVPDSWVETSLNMVSRARVDLLILGGDYQGIPDSAVSRMFGDFRNDEYSNTPSSGLPDAIFSRFLQLLSIASPPDGIIAVYGNHDRRNSPDVCARTFSRREDLRLLENSSAFISRGDATLEIAGVADYLTGVPRVPAPSSRASVRILVCHNPDFIGYALDQAAPASFHLALCGHTHGGQIQLPLLGPLTYNISDLRFAEGLNHHRNTAVYTSRGIGVVELPFRVNCPAETSIFVLQRA